MRWTGWLLDLVRYDDSALTLTASIRAVTIDTTMLGLSAWQVRERKRARGDCSLEFPAVVSEFS